MQQDADELDEKDVAAARALRNEPPVADGLHRMALRPGERIVVEGLLKARPGSEVKPVAASLPAGK